VIISRTPYRISFFGGGTDYPAWYREHGGSVLATTIDKYCYLTCRYLPPFFEHRIRIVYAKVEHVQTVDEIVHPAVREVLRFVSIDRGVEIHHDGDLPARSGMGSSSSFTVGLLHALYALRGRMPSKHQLATEGIYLEQERLRETVGSQDQVSAAYGGFNHITFARSGEIVVRPVTLPLERVRELEAHLMLIFTGINRTASDVAETYVRDVAGNAVTIRRIGEMVDEGLALLAGRDDIAGFGKLLHEGWQAKRALGSRISNSHVEDIYEQARAAGAIGGKLMGAGGGGFLLLFARPSDQPRIRRRLQELLHVPFRFEWSGSQIIFFGPELDYAREDGERGVRDPRRFLELADVERPDRPGERHGA
jgi:D-glycero-alpha-D-manno-heptose-7-phosphate kinase